jgi:DNA-binding winged helix-turn-helix (wHTH) protein
MTRQVAFGDYTLDIDARELLRSADQTSVHLSPKALDLLILLVGERPRAVSKHELHERLWPATFVSEATLASVVSELRVALGERGRTSRYLRTVHRFGYAFATDAHELTGPRATPVLHWLICEGREQPVTDGVHVIGRDVAASISLRSPTVSRRHAHIIVDGSIAVLEDLGSKNGTYLRGHRVSTSVRLADGDEIRIGAFRLVFRTMTSDGLTGTG